MPHAWAMRFIELEDNSSPENKVESPNSEHLDPASPSIIRRDCRHTVCSERFVHVKRDGIANEGSFLVDTAAVGGDELILPGWDFKRDRGAD